MLVRASDRRSGRRIGLCRMALFGALSVTSAGCTPLREYVHNGFKVGPNYKTAPAPVAQNWIDADDVRVRNDATDGRDWWATFNDPILNDLVQSAYHQNLTLREAGWRVLEARAQLGIAIGQIFPQTQTMNGDVMSHGVSVNVANRSATPTRWFGQWDYGFNLAWELDFWGRFRRAIESAEATLEASVESYDDVLVTLIGDVASTYVEVRTLQQQIAYARQTLDLQKQSLAIAKAKFAGGQVSQVDVNQGTSDVATTEALIEKLHIPLRQATNRLCTLMGMPPEDLIKKIGEKPIPTAPEQVAVGIPADLLRRRPDVRKAERLAAAQSAEIGVADADFYPQISLNATWGWSAQRLPQLLAHGSFRELVGPAFQWPIFNYGRILNNVRYQTAKFEELVTAYQNTALKAGREVEDGLVTFLRAQTRTKAAQEAVVAETAAFKEALAQYKGGLVDYNRVVLIQERLVQRQQTLAESQGQIAQGLVQVYRALGGGWQIRCADQPGLPGPNILAAPFADTVVAPGPVLESAPTPAAALEKLPAPAPLPPMGKDKVMAPEWPSLNPVVQVSGKEE